jgi:hypothetical protein
MMPRLRLLARFSACSCVSDVAYTGQYSYDVYSDRFLLDQLHHEGYLLGYEKDATSQRVTVALEIYRRAK